MLPLGFQRLVVWRPGADASIHKPTFIQASPMEFHQLRYFVAAATDLNISKAAVRLFISQPSMSRQIALLEDELGVRLFDRVRKRIHLTEAGVFFLKRANQILCDAETASQQVREQFGGQRPTLRLGFMSTFIDDLVVPVIREYQQRHAQAKVSLFELSPTAQVVRLLNQELDACILADIGPEVSRNYEVIELMRFGFAAVLPAGHLFAARKSVKLAELKDEPWISLADSAFPGRREFFVQTCAKAGFVPRIEQEVDSIPFLLASVGMGSGVAILPAHAAKVPHSGCRFVPLSAPRIAPPLLLVLPRPPRSRGLDTLVSLIVEQSRRMQAESVPVRKR